MQIKNLKFVIRNNLKQKFYSAINIAGFSLGLTCTILILLFSQYEFGFDNFQENSEDIYRITYKNPDYFYEGSNIYSSTPSILSEYLVENIPEVLHSTSFIMFGANLEYNSSRFNEPGFLYASPAFNDVFTFPVIKGNLNESLNEPFSLFVTESMAKKYFGDEDPLGKTIKVNNQYNYTVKGILKDVPENSHFKFDFLTGLESFYSFAGGKRNVNTWNNFSFVTYVKLRAGSDGNHFSSKIQNIIKSHLPEHRHNIEFVTQPLKGIHLGGNINFEPGTNSTKKHLLSISSIGLLILLIAVLNYINMATARAFQRGKEVGIYKVSGSSKTNLIFLFISESLLFSIFGFIISIVLVWISLPVFSSFVERKLTFAMIFESRLFLKILIVVFLSGTIAGLYPAIQMASFNPALLIKGNKYRVSTTTNTNLRSGLVMAQYIISVITIVVTIGVMNQIRFLEESDIGFNFKNVVTVDINDPAIQKNPEVLISELKKNSNIAKVASSYNTPINIATIYTAQNWEGKSDDNNVRFYRIAIDNEFMKLYGIGIIDGRSFSREFSADTLNRYIINEKAVKVLGWNKPVGKRLDFGTEARKGIVVGVCNDFSFQSLRNEIEPLAINLNTGGEQLQGARYLSIKLNGNDLVKTRMDIDETIKSLSPGYLNPTHILENQINHVYIRDKRLANILLYSSLIVILISGIGLYGMSAYTTNNRLREMVVRRVFGSDTNGIVLLFTKEIMKWILLSLIIAWPVSFYLLDLWLQNFKYHINIHVGIFIYSFLLIIIISFLSVAHHIIKTVNISPSVLLRQE
nr:ABC transporter permease [uncultured Draconibacterium sp.]